MRRGNEIVCVVAMARNRVIGRDNQLPWRLPGDLKRFKTLTLGKPVIMGRKTFESIGRPLPKRANIVLTRSRAFASEFENAGIELAHDPEQALTLAERHADRGEIMIIGGAGIYALLLPQTDRIELTQVETHSRGDARFPRLKPSEWRLERDDEGAKATENAPGYRFLTYRRNAP